MSGYNVPSWSPKSAWRRGSESVPPSELRVSDAERHEVVDALSKHFADGRLDQTEFDERMGKAMSAKTRADLSGLLVDLPTFGDQSEPSVRMHRRSCGRPGLCRGGFALLGPVRPLVVESLGRRSRDVPPLDPCVHRDPALAPLMAGLALPPPGRSRGDPSPLGISSVCEQAGLDRFSAVLPKGLRRWVVNRPRPLSR